ncbi:hypothetical protein [Mesorhizobium sp.]|uniref:hypothetical protein n=1 Tax=Mesorhizobium sp. TaxID=1871066 RepID=UPI000FEAA39C|nr:hypothetical protein [Mesorhizobium sp.]RWI35478.1 MAG: hypothetical protein EOR14_28665 [Mesorhizobium sp.]RWJ66353.1 MAG: hypothetical protein EOR34_28470 [Mesorhizobium sp.]
MQLYTVRLLLCKMVSKYGPRGELISATEEDIEHVLHDLPWPTAQMYKDTSAPGKCQIIRQDMSARPAKHERRRESVHFGSRQAAAPTRSAKPKLTAQEKRERAARTGDLSAAISS